MRIASWVVIGAALVVAVARAGADPVPLVGTWRLVSATSTFADGQQNTAPYGQHPKGFITYTRDGRMSAVVSYDGRKPLSGDRASSRVEDRAEAYSTSFAYAGRYTYADGQVTHHVEAATIENWIGTDLVRTVKIDGNRVSLRTPMRPLGGQMQSTELLWERIGAE